MIRQDMHPEEYVLIVRFIYSVGHCTDSTLYREKLIEGSGPSYSLRSLQLCHWAYISIDRFIIEPSFDDLKPKHLDRSESNTKWVTRDRSLTEGDNHHDHIARSAITRAHNLTWTRKTCKDGHDRKMGFPPIRLLPCAQWRAGWGRDMHARIRI